MILFILSGVNLLTFCKQKTVIAKNQRLIDNLEKSKGEISSFRARIKATFVNKKINQSLNNLRIKKDKFLWMVPTCLSQ